MTKLKPGKGRRPGQSHTLVRAGLGPQLSFSVSPDAKAEEGALPGTEAKWALTQ